MSTYTRTILVLANRRSPGHCKYCGKPIEWALKASTKRRDGSQSKATNVPLNPNAMTLRVERSEGGVKFDVLDAAALHFTTCTKQPSKPWSSRPFRRSAHA